MSRLTFTRGPNSILFSIGNPGGAIDVTTHKADLRQNAHSVELRADTFDGFRSALDSNVVIVPRKLALRLDVLHDDRGNASEPSKDLRNSIFGTVTAQLARDTVLYANVESTRMRQQIPRPYETFDWVNTWIDAGRITITTTARISGDLNHIKLFGRGLGRFAVAGLYNNEASHGTLETFTEVNLTPLPGSTPDLSDARNNTRRRGYLVPGPGYFVSDWAPIDEGGIRSNWEQTRQPRNRFTRTASIALAGQASLFDNLVALTAGIRRDDSSITETSYARDARGLYSEGRWGGAPLPNASRNISVLEDQGSFTFAYLAQQYPT